MLDKEITSAFDSMIGQNDFKARAQMHVQSAKNGEDMKSMLITGESGLGKTHALDAMSDAYSAIGCDVVRVSCPSELVDSTYVLLADQIRNARKTVVVIDEAHRLTTVKRVQVGRIRTFVMLFTDERNTGKQISINDGELGVDAVDWKKLCFILASNFPAKLEEGKESTSFQSRLMFNTLSHYSFDEIMEILAVMIKKHGLRINENTVKLIANCARGTARPLQNICDELKAMQSAYGYKTTLNREQVVEAIRLSKHFPSGLESHEVGMLNICLASAKKQTTLATLFPNLDTTRMRHAMAYLQGKEFLGNSGHSGFATTDKGRRYLESIKKDGFQIPAIG